MRMLGTTLLLHPFAAAMPAAVVGPPTLALEARRSVRRGHRCPTNSSRPRCTNTCTRANMNSAGAELSTWLMLPLAPTAAKNICTQRFPHRQGNSEYSGLFSGSLLEITKRLREHCLHAYNSYYYIAVTVLVDVLAARLLLPSAVGGMWQP